MRDVLLLNADPTPLPVMASAKPSGIAVSGDSSQNKWFAQSALLFGAGLGAILFALRVVGHVNESLVLWPVTGLVVSLCLPLWVGGWQQRLRLILSAGVGVFAGGILLGQPLWLSSTIGMLTAIDLVIAGAILSPHVRCFEDLKHGKNIFRLLQASIVAPLLSGFAGAFPVSIFLKMPFLQTEAMSTLANSLGMVVVIPAVLFLVSGEYRSFSSLVAFANKAARPGVPFLAISSFVFWQNRGPFLFIVFPPMIVVLLALGLEGAVLTSLSLSVIGWIATSHGHGPIMLMSAATPEFRLLVLQVFIWVSLATALPVGALLDERKRAERAAEESRSIYELLMQHTQDAIVLSTVDGSRRYVSPGITQLAGWTPHEYAELDRMEIVHPEDRDVIPMLLRSLTQGKRENQIRYRMMHKDGSWKWVEATVRGYGEGKVTGYVGTVRDISAFKESEDGLRREVEVLSDEKQQLERLAQIDPLTGLLNRRGLNEMLGQQTNLGRRELAVLMIDVDHFKLYNDTYGHHAGDDCLTTVARALRTRAHRDCDLVARLGGEEFAILLPETNVEGALKVAEEIRQSLAAMQIQHEASRMGLVTLSIGVASKTGREKMDLNLLLSQADRALYVSKHNGRDRATVFGSDLESLPA